MIEYVVTACTSFTFGSAVTWMLRHKIYRALIIFRNINDDFERDEPRMVIVARTDLPITTGKLASQCAHAAVSCYSLAKKLNPDFSEYWEARGQPKIVVKCSSESALMKLAHQAKGSKIISAIIEDAGRTQTRSGTKTVLGIGPARKEDIDKVTGHLKLF